MVEPLLNKSNFNTSLHKMVLCEDGTFSAYSKQYKEHYHSIKDGALFESLQKHIIPCIQNQKYKLQINILDICFGLGFNTLGTLHYIKQNNIKSKIKIYSPELDKNLIKSLQKFSYPKEFKSLAPIINAISKNSIYEDKNIYIEVFLGDARDYIKEFKNYFDIVYQDAFSPKKNLSLWTREYFKDIQNVIKKDGILSTYSISLTTRIALLENGFNVYLNEGEGFRSSTLASLNYLKKFKEVDVKHKMICNPDVMSLRD